MRHQAFPRLSIRLIPLFLAGVAFPSWSSAQAPSRQVSVVAETTIQAGGIRQPWTYLLYTPDAYQHSQESWPLLVYLHGRSVRGEDVHKIKRYGPPSFLDRRPDFPFLVLSPQLPDGSWPTTSLLKLIDEVVAKHRIDRERIYLTGVSLGGGGAWYLAAADPDRFAAFAPVCGYGDLTLAPKLKNLPIWAFHGAEDEVLPVETHQTLINAVNAAGGEAKLTVIPNGDHGNIITPVYRKAELYEWMLAQSRGTE